MTRPSQKKEEAFYASFLANKLKEEWEVLAPESEEEWPDLLVKYDNSEFGLEVRSIFKDESIGAGSPLRCPVAFSEDLLQQDYEPTKKNTILG